MEPQLTPGAAITRAFASSRQQFTNYRTEEREVA